MSVPDFKSTALSKLSHDVVDLVEHASKSVVGVEHGRGAGSGFVLTPDGYILTNRHVVTGTKKAKISFSDGEIITGEVLGGDQKTDLSVVKVEAPLSLPHLSLVDKRRVKVGQLVVAIGNPFRFERSVSWGVVSAIDRSLPSEKSFLEGLIQTDAAINPGNSGGPLISTEAEVIGVNTAIVPYAQGLGFAVPSYTANWVAGELIRTGQVKRRFLGVSATSIDLSAKHLGQTQKRRAVMIARVETNSPADKAGLREGDILLDADAHELWNLDDLQRVLALGESRDISLLISRKKIQSHLTVRPAEQNQAA